MTSPTSEPLSRLRCIACGADHDAGDIRYHCDACGDLLEVAHDLGRIAARYPDLRERFEHRLGAREAPWTSGVWRYHEIILPDLPVDRIVSLEEGNTPLYRSPLLSRLFDTPDLALKHEGMNPTLSFKDRGMTAGVSWARHLGARLVACASTGDTSAAMAAYAAHVDDMQAVVFLPRGKVSPEQLAQPICFGAKTIALDTDFDGCMKLVREISARYPVYLLNSMNSFRVEGQKAIGIEVCQQRGWTAPDWFVIPVGNAGNISALGKGLAEAHTLGLIDRLPRIAGVQAAAADPFFRSWQTGFAEHVRVTAGPTLASAIRIGDPVSHDKAAAVVRRFGGVVESVDEHELMDAKARADRAGVSVCPNSGVALAGLRKLRAAGTIGAGESVVVILTAHGLKFARVGVEYHTGGGAVAGGVSAAESNAPVELPADLDAIVGELGLG